ncbi:antiterminator Q family protein [Erwinia sp. BNK-24-b]|uniref:antiterminator Q family protein n=1 Tax=Erwinia TaxID=551 RepID=UPI001FEF2017|nr:antiterminator Q family protein [Erwinia phyllosphaerae]MBV4366366.1 antitermination protein [Erwinia phyllosphaerae]
MRDMKSLLEKWGGWAATERSGVNYAHVAAGFRGLVTAVPAGRPVCSDNDGMILDNCISRLKVNHPDQYALLVAHYHYRISLRSIARRRRCADGTIRKQLQAAEGFVEGVLSALEIELEDENDFFLCAG